MISYSKRNHLPDLTDDQLSRIMGELVRLIILLLRLIKLLALQLSLTLAKFCAPDESIRTVTIFRALRCAHPHRFCWLLGFHLNSRL